MEAAKGRRVERLDCIRLDKNDKTYFTDEGYLIDHPILTSCGIFEYYNSDGSVRRELRLPEHVFAEKSLESYKGKPIIITHDAGLVNKDNVKDEEIGTILSTGYKDGNDVRAEIVIHNTDEMKECGFKELSLGYNLDLIEEPGEWNGKKYDAIQTNIVINHLALVAQARAGEQARLNIDSSDKSKEGGKIVMNIKHHDGETVSLTPEELVNAIKAFKESQGNEQPSEEVPTQEEDGAMPDEETMDFPTDDPEDDEKLPDAEDEAGAEMPEEDTEAEGKSPEDIANAVKERRDARCDEDIEDVDKAKEVIGQMDSDIDELLACIEKLVAELKGNQDSADEEEDIEKKENLDNDYSESLDLSEEGNGTKKPMNADSVDKMLRQRLSICRVGDKLNMDGLENKSIIDGKKAIIAKVLPSMRLDGKTPAYIDAAYDMAVNEVKKKRSVNAQRKQMANGIDRERFDGHEGTSMATSARERMINRGGNR